MRRGRGTTRWIAGGQLFLLHGLFLHADTHTDMMFSILKNSRTKQNRRHNDDDEDEEDTVKDNTHAIRLPYKRYDVVLVVPTIYRFQWSSGSCSGVSIQRVRFLLRTAYSLIDLRCTQNTRHFKVCLNCFALCSAFFFNRGYQQSTQEAFYIVCLLVPSCTYR